MRLAAGKSHNEAGATSVIGSMRTPRVIASSIVVSAALLLPGSASAALSAPAAVPATGTPPRLQEAAFISPQRGYGLFDSAGTRVCEAEVAATANGGARFGRPHVAARWSCDGNDP